MKYVTRAWQYLRDKGFRLLDMHIGLLGVHLFAEAFCWRFSTCLDLLGFTLDLRWPLMKSAWVLISVSIDHHPHPHWREERCYPPITFKLKLLNTQLIDTGAAGHERIKKSLARYDREEEEQRQRRRSILENLMTPKAAEIIAEKTQAMWDGDFEDLIGGICGSE